MNASFRFIKRDYKELFEKVLELLTGQYLQNWNLNEMHCFVLKILLYTYKTF